MAKYNITKTGGSLVVTLVVTLNDFKQRVNSFLSPSIALANDKIKFYENGVYVCQIQYHEFNQIGGATPTTPLDAATKIIALIA